MTTRYPAWLLLGTIVLAALAACGPTGAVGVSPEADPVADPVADPEPGQLSEEELAKSQLVIYSGRSESLAGPIIQEFQDQTGVEVAVRWGATAELAATILEEGANTPADVFYAQDPGGLGALEPMFAELPDELTERVDPRFRDPEGRWVGITGRSRVVVYNTVALDEEDLPDDIWGFTDPDWRGRLGWAPTNASFQAMVTAMRVLWGEAAAADWLRGILSNDPEVFSSNTPVVAAVGAGEIDVGFVNHYYLYRFLAEEGDRFPARNYFIPEGGPGALVMVSGAGILRDSENGAVAAEFLKYLLSDEIQARFAAETYEYPLVPGVTAPPDLVPLDQLHAPDIRLSQLADLRGTLELLREVGALP